MMKKFSSVNFFLVSPHFYHFLLPFLFNHNSIPSPHLLGFFRRINDLIWIRFHLLLLQKVKRQKEKIVVFSIKLFNIFTLKAILVIWIICRKIILLLLILSLSAINKSCTHGERIVYQSDWIVKFSDKQGMIGENSGINASKNFALSR